MSIDIYTSVQVSPGRLAQLRRIGTASVLLTVSIGGVAMTGWIVGIDALKSVVPGLITMKANTALTFMVLGLSLFVLRPHSAVRARFAVILGFAGALFALAFSALVFSQYVHGVNLGVDEFLFEEADGAVGTVHAGRMALNASICFMLASVGALIARSRMGPILSPVIGLAVSGAGLLALIGYATGVTSLYGIPQATQMAVPTATGFVLLGAALITGHPDKGPLQLVASNGPGGALVRRVLPLGVAGTILLAILRLAGQEAGLYGTQVGTWLLVSGVIALFIPLVWRTALSLERANAERAALSRDKEEILRSIGSGIYRVDAEGRTTFVNPAAAQILGWSEDELVGRHMHATTHHTCRDGSPYHVEHCPIYAAFRDGEVHHREDEVFWRKDGSNFDVEYTSAPVRERGRIVGASVVFRDISERYAAERAKDEFTSVVSHELRTPLTSIRGSLGLLESGVLGPLPEKGQRMIEIAVENTDRLVRLINDILDIERIDSGQVDMHKEPCDGGELIARATESLESLALEGQVTLHAEVSSVPVSADRDRILQTLTNLISNAVKFSPAQSTVEVSCAQRGGEVVFAVSDEGRGIPADKLDSIFGRFQQVDASDSREKGGTGLGLAICRTIVENHDGRIWAESVPGEGSTFSFALPAVVEGEIASGDRDPSAGPKVLVCDDDAAVVEVVGAMLEQRGYRVVGTTSGKQALERAVTGRPDAILLDLLMPGRTGWDLAATLEERPETSSIPVIALSVLAKGEREGPKSPLFEWLEKPVDERALFDALERAVALQSV